MSTIQINRSYFTSRKLFACLLATALFASAMAGLLASRASASSPDLIINTQTQNGSTITGYWVEVTTPSGTVVQTGYSTAQFSLASGNYLVAVGDYGGYNFTSWSDGSVARFHPVIVNSSGAVSLTAIYAAPGGGGGGGSATITVNSQYINGNVLNGMYTILQQNGQTIATGFTPVTFSVTSGESYTVTADDYTNAYFNYWSTGQATRTISVTTLSSSTSLVSYYSQSPPTAPSNSITVKSVLLNGTAISGMFVDLRINGTHIQGGYTPITFSGLQLGVQYGVVVYWYGNDYIRYINDTNTGMDLQRYDLVTLNQSNPSDTLTGMYEYVPPSLAASLNILAEFPNGTLIGSSAYQDGYIQHSPGMWLQVIPPGWTTPYTGTFTGGSILPFIFFNYETYTVQMTTGYQDVQFSHWQDNNSTNPNRAFALNGNATYVAIYVQT